MMLLSAVVVDVDDDDDERHEMMHVTRERWCVINIIIISSV
jgi:short-subunit dehydrogenase involved in D-alanine esterification of teichoic acids